MSNPPKGFNTDASFNKFKGTYYNNDIDVSGGDIISRTGNLYLAPNSSIFTESNQILFNEEFQFTDFVNNVNVLGQLKNTYNSIEYDVGLQCEKVDTLVTDVATLSPIVSDTAYKCTNFYYDVGQNSTIFSNNVSFASNSIASTSINNNNRFVDLTSNNVFTGTNQFSQSVRLDNNLRLQGALITDNGTTNITNVTLSKINFLSNVTSDINGSISALNTKTTNISFAGLTTSFGGILSFPNNSISGAAISTGSLAVAKVSGTAVNLSTNQTITSTKTYSVQQIFNSSIRCDDSLILNSNTLTIPQSTLQKIQYLSTVSSDIQTQINNISGVSLSASNIFTGTTNQFQNTIRIDGAINLNANALVIPQSTLQKIQYLSNITSDISTSLQTLTDKMSGFYRSETTGTYFFTSNLNTEGKFNTLTPYEIGNLTGTTEPLQIAINALKTKTDTTNINLATTTTNANDALQRTTEISFSATPTPQTNITSKCVTEELVFTTDLNDITPTTFGYLANCSSNIQTQLNSKIDTLQGTIIQHISSNLQSIFPTKYLLCNGQAVSRTTYNILFSIIGTTYGSGDGGTTYNVPNFEACFLRMYSEPRTFGGVVYTPSPVGTIQQDSMEAHVHSTNLSGSYLNNSTTNGSLFTFGTNKYNTTNFPSFGGGVSASHRTTTETRCLNHSVYFYITC